MVRDGIHTAVLDRFGGDYAILQLEADGEAADQVMVERSTVPEEGTHQDVVFTVEASDTGVAAIQYEPAATEERRAAARARFDRLATRLDDDADS